MKRLFHSIFKISIGITIIVLCFGFVGTVSAQTNPSDTFGLQTVSEEISISTETTDLRVTVVRIINIFLGFLGVIAVCIVLYGGYLYMTSGGDDEKIGTAKKLLINGAIGLVIILSAFGITTFIFSRLQDAITNTPADEDEDLWGSCDDTSSPYYARYATTRCAQFCNDHPTQCASSQYFIVKSITPHTPEATDSTGMNNSIIRALFSKQPAGDVDNVFKIYRKENGQDIDISNQFDFSFEEGGVMVAAAYNQGAECATGAHCIPNGEYEVRVNENLRDILDRELTLEASSQTFPRIALFRTGITDVNPIIDTEFSSLVPISIGGYSGADTYRVVRGETYTIKGKLEDTHGNAYAYVKVYREGTPGSTIVQYVDGPLVQSNSGSTPLFDFEYALRIESNKFSAGVVYVAEVIAHDIDGNTESDTVRFMVVPASCTNGVLDAGETGIDQGGVCGGAEGNSCTSQSDCAYWLQCLDSSNNTCTGSNCTCKTVPYISSVEYMDGAAGNWITILGKNFGSSIGEVSFDYDIDQDGDIDSHVTATLPQCREGVVWNNSWIIAEVPRQIDFSSQDDVVGPSISVTAASGLSDSTNDNFGPRVGIFTYNTTQRPNLCSVTVSGERIVTLEDGSSVTIPDGSSVAPQNTPVVLEGTGFGSSVGEVIFGRSGASITSWSGEVINSVVPFTGEGETSVYVTSDSGQRSNPVPFEISSPTNLRPPTITSIDPPTATRGSFITISGNRFGLSGNVYFSKNEGVNCQDGGSACILAGTLPQTCGNTWSDAQVIVKVPNDPQFELGKYFVVVVREDGVKITGSSSVEIVAGVPAPSICRIDPNRGVAPISSESSAIIIYGENFIADSEVKFWYPFALANNPDSWLSTVSGITQGQATIVDFDSQEIKTTIPYDTVSGLSMSSGPIKVKNASGVFSNSINYTVLDCRESGSPSIPGFQCCSEGPDAGRWKHGNYACEGVSRDAGYVWRFTSGKMPQKFFVNELCSETELPSPSPSTLWNDGRNICVNAQLTVSFNLPVNASTVLDQSGNLVNIAIAECAGSDTQINCAGDEKNVTTDFSGEEMGENALIFQKKDGTYLSAQTWYRIGLSSAISSLRFDQELGVSIDKSENLESTRTCEIDGVTYAYCFDFRTGSSDFQCSLIGAGIHPEEHTTTLLGVVQTLRGKPVYDINRVFNVSAVRPLVYGVYGRSNLACTTINVDDRPWVWGPVDSAYATSKQMVGQANSKGYAIAWQHNPAGSLISASITENNGEIKATSTLRINLGDPYAKNVWPSCIEACVNAEIGIEFSQIMDIDTFDADKLTLHECVDETCNTTTSPSILLALTSDLQSETILRAYPVTPLKKNTWYLVQLKNGIQAVGGVITDINGVVVDVISGSSATTKEWKFRTKDSTQLCLADSVRVSPDPFYATFIGEAQMYRALPVGSPDSCSAYGQQLNPWNYGWNWSVGEVAGQTKRDGVAKVSNFSFGGSSKSTCTIGCTPAGSDIARSISKYPVCGNGEKELGEDCDIAGIQPSGSLEIPGISCSFSCLRPGNNDAATCGNGVVETRLGEECDPAQSGAIPGYCTNTCINAGSGSEPLVAGDVNAPVCGGGDVGFGEDCDIGDSDTTNGCSNRCVHLGSPTSQAWCDGWLSYFKNPTSVNDSNLRTQYGEVSLPEFTSACSSAVSVCGNGVIEQGEECESGDSQCSSRCLVQNDACGTSYEQCSPGDEGCLSNCTYAGSSITYSTPSICGDGVVGIGEYSPDADEIRSCELPAGEVRNILGGNPVQVVTAVGDLIGTSVAQPISDMGTKINAGTNQGLGFDGLPILITPISGSGEYHLQCGYTEYAAPASDQSYNNCPANASNNFGVATNSCCIERPQRIEEYPLANAGIGAGSAPVCRNTYISVTFNQNIPSEYLQSNIQLVQGFAAGYSCTAHGGQDVTNELRSALALNDFGEQRLWPRIWNSIKSFFSRMIRVSVLAAPQSNALIPSDLVLCSGITPFTVKPTYETGVEGVITKTLVSIYPNQVLDLDQYILVRLKGGIKNFSGVSIKSPFNTELSDYWVFKTGAQICKIQEIVVEPSAALYTVPNSSKSFVAQALSSDSGEKQKIVSIPGVYAWTWNWGPQGDAIFDIPATVNVDNSITSKGVRGHTDGVVGATTVVSADYPQAETFSAMVSLEALFCQRPWPFTANEVTEDDVDTGVIFKDNTYNFSMYYCADSGSPLSTLDDLPYFNQIEIVTDPTALGAIALGDLPDALRRYLLFADKTDDAIGVQIFANPTKSDGTRQTLSDWYVTKFGSLASVQSANVAGYEALTNEFNLYINAFNLNGDTVYNNVYLFSIDTNATPETKEVFKQLIASLRFNTNLTNHNRCLREGALGVRETPNELAVPPISCTTDFDCRDSVGIAKIGTNGTCSNALTKFMRDLIRLEQLHTIQMQTDSYLDSID